MRNGFVLVHQMDCFILLSGCSAGEVAELLESGLDGGVAHCLAPVGRGHRGNILLCLCSPTESSEFFQLNSGPFLQL